MPDKEILRACIASGWDARTEAAGTGWRADVLATRGTVRLAFEVQWSGQTAEETRARQAGYEAAGVRCCWFFRRPPRSLIDGPERSIPLFGLCKTNMADRTLTVSHLGRAFQLGEFVSLLLSRRIQFRERETLAPRQHVRVDFYERRCWKCQAFVHDYVVQDGFKTCCGTEGGRVDPDYGYASDIKYLPQVVDGVRRFLDTTDSASRLRVGTIKQRYSNVVGASYVSIGCANCGVLFGKHYDFAAFAEAVHNGRGSIASLDLHVDCTSVASLKSSHWCLSLDHQFCGDSHQGGRLEHAECGLGRDANGCF